MFQHLSGVRCRVSAQRLLVAATLAVVGSSLSISSVALADGPEASRTEASSPRVRLDDASRLIAKGRVVYALELLRNLTIAERASRSMTNEELSETFDLVAKAQRQMRQMDPSELSLQKAELALSKQDLREAERHAKAVAAGRDSTGQQITQASTMLSRISELRTEFAPMVPSMLERATQAFESGRYAECRGVLDTIQRSGIELSLTQHSRMSSYLDKIVNLELARGQVFSTDSTLASMMQPGLIHPRDKKADDKKADDQRAGDEPPASGDESAQPVSEETTYLHDHDQHATDEASADDATDMQSMASEPPATEEAPAASEPAAEPPVQEAPPAEDPITRAMQIESQRILAEADRAYDEAKYGLARDKYTRLLNEFPGFMNEEQLQHVHDRRDNAVIRMGGPGIDLDSVAGTRALAKEKVLSEIDSLLGQTVKAMSTGDIQGAQGLVAKAKLTLSSGRDLFPEAEYAAHDDRISAMGTQISLDAEAQERQHKAEIERQIQKQAAERERQSRMDRQKRINEHLVRARALQAERKWDEALEIINQVLFLDPNNPAALFLRDIISDIRIYVEYNEIDRKRQIGFAMNSLDNATATIPPMGVINFPSDWPSLSIRRGEPSAFAELPENRRVLAEIETRRIPANFNENALADVFGFIESITQLDIDIDWASLEELGITPDSTVTLKLREVPVRTVLDRVLDKVSEDPLSKADWAVTDGILTIASEDQLRRNTVLQIYDIRDLLIEIPDYDEVPDIDLQSVLQSNQGGGGGGRSPFRNDQQNDELDTRPLDERIQDIIDIIETHVDPEGWEDNGGDTGSIQQLQGQMIISNTPKNHRAIAGLLSKLREVRAMQINVETRFLLVNQDFFEQIGFDLDVVVGSNNNQVRFAQQNDPTIQGGDFFDFSGAGGGNVGLQRNVTGARFDFADNDAPFTQGVVNPRPFSPIGFGQNSLGLTQALAPASGIAADILSGAPALGIAGQFLDDIQVDFLVQATQADRRSVNLTAPRLTFTNGQTANIFVATQQSFVSDLQPVVGDSAVGFDPTVNVVTEGVTLLVTGTISADRRYVTMNVDAGVSRIDGFASQPVTAVAGGQLVNSADTQSFIQLPTVTVTRVRTTVTIPDQGTILLGGQRVITEFDVETGVPVLSKIPVLNRFFTNRIESKEEQTLLILMKPTVLIQNEEEETHFPGLLDRLRSGFGN